MTRRWAAEQLDRAAGVLLGLAAGDALGAGFEFGPALTDDTPVGMVGGGVFGWAPGEWTDDTSMAIAIAEVAADGLDLGGVEGQDRVAARWIGWAGDAPDVGVQTRQVLADGQELGDPHVSGGLRWAAFELHQRTGRTAGNGSLMRTAPVALAYLDEPEEALVAAAHALSNLTHADPEAGEACVLWCLSIRYAVLNGTFDGVDGALRHLPAERRTVWQQRLREAEQRPTRSFTNNGWVVEALQAAWSAITHTDTTEAAAGTDSTQGGHLERALVTAVRGGGDTDTVAAIAGGLLGARWGASVVPSAWRELLHGWPGLAAADLQTLTERIVSR